MVLVVNGSLSEDFKVPGPPKLPKTMAKSISQNGEYRQHRVHCFGHFGGPGSSCPSSIGYISLTRKPYQTRKGTPWSFQGDDSKEPADSQEPASKTLNRNLHPHMLRIRFKDPPTIQTPTPPQIWKRHAAVICDCDPLPSSFVGCSFSWKFIPITRPVMMPSIHRQKRGNPFMGGFRQQAKVNLTSKHVRHVPSSNSAACACIQD